MSWAEVKKINSDLSEPLDTKISAVETKVDTVDTVVDNINTNVGSNADSASATGSVHAKLKDIKDEIRYNTVGQVEYYNSSPTVSVFYTALNKTSGSGKLNKIHIFHGSSVGNLTIRITIDSVATTLNINTSACWSEDDTNARARLFPMVYFNSNCKVEIAGDTTANLGLGIEYIY